MNLTEGFLKDSLFIDFGTEIHYGSDQVNISYPLRIATVEFQLVSTGSLSMIADRMRKDLGFRPFHPLDDYSEEMCDLEGWYDFFISVNDWKGPKADSCIEFVVVNSDSPDNEEKYTIDLDGNEQAYVYSRLDEQCRACLGKGCEDLLHESREELEAE